ncbi:MAG: TlyA family RNA methyltransferase [Spirochaetia bacterium]|nr:TlyA family RNA methyltransferase [Spirochaetia bacterium]MBQ6674410.1 TlyA family RNA methyltransferase [Spirochaetia bacterium]
MKKVPLLTLLKNKYPEYSADKLYSHILCGEVVVDGGVIKNPKELFAPGTDVILTDKKYVSRGGFKLEKALMHWGIDVKGKVVLDAGSSTGGFTDCLLQHGTMQVHAVDSGSNQLDFKLRQNPAVLVREKTNIMELNPGDLEPQPDIAVCDLSFRSIVKAASHILSLTREKKLIALVKPQFEERGLVPGFDGVIKKDDDVRRVLAETARLLAEDGTYIKDMIESPILGTKGNREFLCIITDSDQ